MAFILFRKGLKRAFFGRKPNFPNKPLAKKELTTQKASGSLVVSRNPARLSLSIHGEKQPATLLTVNIKNMESLKNTGAERPLQEIVDLAEKYKCATYENNGSFFFIFAPAKTRTFKNEKVAVNLARYVLEVLNKYNRIALHKIDFGVSVAEGIIVAKYEDGVLEFMSMGTLITSAKKAASFANDGIYLTKPAHDKLMNYVKSEKLSNGDFYRIKEIKTESEENQKFIRRFVDNLEKEKRK